MTEGAGPRPGGRTARNSDAIYTAVLDLITTVGVDFTLQDVSERAGVSRRTLHRRWPDRHSLIAGALDVGNTEFQVQLTDDFAQNVREFAYRYREFSESPREITINGLAATAPDPTFARMVVDSWTRVDTVTATLIDKAHDGCQVPTDADVETSLTMLMSSITVWCSILRTPPDDETLDRWVRHAVTSAGQRDA